MALQIPPGGRKNMKKEEMEKVALFEAACRKAGLKTLQIKILLPSEGDFSLRLKR